METFAAEVHVEDSRGTDCGAPACLVTVENATDPSSAEVDASQNTSYVGVATRQRTALVDENVTLRGDRIVVPADFRPVRRAFDAAKDRMPGSDRFGVVDNESGYYAYADPAGAGNLTLEAWEWDSSGQGVHEDGTGPANAYVERRSSDDRLADLTWREACPFAPDPAACGAAQRSVYERWNDSTPNVDYGLSWYRIQVADDPAKLDRVHLPVEAPLPASRALARAPLLEPARERLPDAAPGMPSPLPPSAAPDPRPAGRPVSSEARVLRVETLRAPGLSAAIGLGTTGLVAGVAVSLLLREWISAFTRLDRSRLLEEPTRARVYEIVARHPGIHVAEIARQAGVAWGLAHYHVRLLRGHGYVVPQGRRGWVATSQREAAPGWTAQRSFREQILADGYGKDSRVTREWVHATYEGQVSRSLRNRAMREIDRLAPR